LKVAKNMKQKSRRKLLGQILKEMRVIHEGQVQEALQSQRDGGSRIGEVLLQMGAITEDQLLEALGRQAGMEVINLTAESVDAKAAELIDATTATMYGILPVRIEPDGSLLVAMSNPMNLAILDDVRFTVNRDLKGAICDEASLKAAIDKIYGAEEDGQARLVKAMERDAAEAASDAPPTTGPIDLEDAEAMARSAPVVKLLNYVFYRAIKDKSSDIHLEPFEDRFKIRYRVDGVLYELESPPQHLATALISRVKVMANLDISETRLPQDGRIELAIGGRPVDLRVSTLPTMFGESCVMRVLDRTVVSLSLDQIGMRDDELVLFRQIIQKPNGIVLVTGPTGSGKTTTLYSALNEVNEVTTKIITTEDPVEYDLEGIIQVQVNEDIGVTYAKCLRSIVRQDPDKILVGEIRDPETAAIAVQASLTGHLVFSTVHTNDAPLAITRMTDIGVEPFLLAATLEAVVAQRLVRRVCVDCKTYYEPGPEVVMELQLSPDDVIGKQFAYGKGCETCAFTGYRGRVGLFEIMVLTERIRTMILETASTDEVRTAARADGMRTLRESGLLAIFDGVTSIEEVIRETLIGG
jgi:type IV pilus assembly protein PilB